MLVVDANSALLSDCEVLLLLKEIQENKRKLKDNKQLATIAYESIRYLEDSAAAEVTPQQVKDFLIAVKDKFRLTKAEKLQILNQRPNTLVELQLLIEENEERFSEEAMDQLLIIVNNTLNANIDNIEEENNDITEDENSDESWLMTI